MAVVVTLAYLAIQIRQNTKSNRYLSTQNLVANEAQGDFVIAAHDDLAANNRENATVVLNRLDEPN